MDTEKYKTAKSLLELGAIEQFKELADYLPYTRLAEDIQVNRDRVKKLLTEDPPDITVHEMVKIATVLDVDLEILKRIIIKEADARVKTGL